MGASAAAGPAPLRSGLAGALFSSVEQRVLALLFGQPERGFQKSEIVRRARSGTGAVYRLLDRWEAAGLVEVTEVGNQRYYRANQNAPIFPELHLLAVKTVGLVEPLRRALAPLAERIDVAFVYGSVASGADTARSDIDLLIVSDRVAYPEVIEATLLLEQELGRRVDPTILSPGEWRERSREDGFVRRVKDRPKWFVIGTPDDLP
jgi:predicted nucleotidyltransferase